MQNGRVKPGDSVAVVGAGPVGMAAIMTAAIAGASRIIAIDTAASRLRPRSSARRTRWPPGTTPSSRSWTSARARRGRLDRGGGDPARQRIESEKLGTHRFALDEIMEAYDVFGAAGEHNAQKVVLSAA